MDSYYPVFNAIQMRYINVRMEAPTTTDVDIKEIEDALLKFADDMIKS